MPTTAVIMDSWRPESARRSRRRGNYVEAERYFREASEVYRKLPSKVPSEFAMTLGGLADVLQLQGNRDEAGSLAREASAILARAENSDTKVEALSNLAPVLERRGDYLEVERLLRAARVAIRTRRSDEHPDVGKILVDLASVLEHQGRQDDAEQQVREGLRIFEMKLPLDHSGRSEANGVLGTVLAARGAFVEAEPLMLEAYAALMDRADVAVNDKRELVERIARLYESWDAAEPGKGYAEKAAEWRAKLGLVPLQSSRR